MLKFKAMAALGAGALLLQACGGSGGKNCGPFWLDNGGGGFPTVNQAGCADFTAWEDVQPGERVNLAGEYTYVSYAIDGDGKVTSGALSEQLAGGLQFTFDENSVLDQVSINAGPASVDFNSADGDVGISDAFTVAAVSADGEDIAIFANSVDRGFSYQTFGLWLTGYVTGSGVIGMGTFGNRTALINVPAGDAATYSGGTYGFAIDADDNPLLIQSDAEVALDFDTQTFTFDTTESWVLNLYSLDQFTDDRFNLTGAGDITGATFAGDVETTGLDMAGTVDGWMYGDAADEVGGLFALDGPDGRYAGSFGAKKVVP